MTYFKQFFFYCVFASQAVLSQNDSITRLREVIVSDVKLRKFSSTQTIISLTDSILSKNTGLLTNALNYNTVLYFKEYGRGMLSTVAFRGTTAAQTAVIWNGININSQMNGSTDFNTLTSNDYNSVQVKGGGGSVIYGSGAIGGTLHLGTNLSFTDVISNETRFDYGSFNTQNILYRGIFSNKKWSTQFGFSRNSSTNDYKFPDSYDWRGNQRYNENGDYEVHTLHATLGYKFKEGHYLKLYSQSSNTDRNISLLSSSESRTKYKNDFSRNLLEYQANSNKWITYLRTAFITEGYQYFEDNTKPHYSFGATNTWIVKADINHQFNSKLLVNALVEYNFTKGEGSGFGTQQREISSFAILAKYEATKNWQNEFGIRKEVTTNYESPVLFSLGSSWHGISWYQIKANVSHNFRIPTYNDLYWESGGNPNLKPESAYQGEISNVFKYRKISLTQTLYYNKIRDLLRWLPGNNGVWAPQNTDRVQAYGTEVLFNWNKHIGQGYWQFNSTYAYTISQNEETQNQLFFVPFHKATASLSYAIKRCNVNYQILYNGFVYTQADNNPEAIIPAYSVSNLSIDYELPVFNKVNIGAQVLNVLDHKYVSLEHRIMPGRNFNMYIIFKF